MSPEDVNVDAMGLKRCFDFLAALCMLVFLAPVIFVTALLVIVNMGTPILFRQTRPGFKGQPFMIYKFRTMRDVVAEQGRLLPDENRLTSLGSFLRKYSLDELPQLLNVLKGDLSLVGPRPLLMEYLPRYSAEQARRHGVRPGITGWAQVNGRNALTWEEKFRLDVWYVDNRSFLLDLKILWMTVMNVVCKKDINYEGHATMPEFMGSHDNKDERQ